MTKTTTVQFSPARDGGVMTKVDGRVAFPDRRLWRGCPQPQDGDIWEVEIAGENPRQTVYFLRPVRRVSTRAEQEQAAAEKRARERVKNRVWSANRLIRRRADEQGVYVSLPNFDDMPRWLSERGMLDAVVELRWSILGDAERSVADRVIDAAATDTARLAMAHLPDEWQAASALHHSVRANAQRAVYGAAYALENNLEGHHPWCYREGGPRGWVARELSKFQAESDLERTRDWAREALREALDRLVGDSAHELRWRLDEMDADGESDAVYVYERGRHIRRSAINVASGIEFRLDVWTETEHGVGRKDSTSWTSRVERLYWVIGDMQITVTRYEPTTPSPRAFDNEMTADELRAAVAEAIRVVEATGGS